MFIIRRGGKDVEHRPNRPDTPRRKFFRNALGYFLFAALYVGLALLADYKPFTEGAFFHWLVLVVGILVVPVFILLGWAEFKIQPGKIISIALFETIPLLLIAAGIIMIGLSYWYGNVWMIAGYASMLSGFVLVGGGLLFEKLKRSNK
jgi:hypothetical protein